MSPASPIGVFDSGIGGVSVLREIRRLLPAEELIYVGDSIHLPYGEKSLEEIRRYTEAVVQYLIHSGCKIVVIACNTASAAALSHVREKFPQLPIVGMEPAVKPAVEHTRSGVVGVIATTATFQGQLFASVVERFAGDVTVLKQPCPGLVQQIEAGELETAATEKMLRGWLQPMLAAGMDELVLACTHYPFVLPLLRRICGPDVNVIDPAPALARQTQRVLANAALLNQAAQSGELTYFTTGNTTTFARTLNQLTGDTAEINPLYWNNTGTQLSR
ncbi:MAG: glutamate racemase [Bacteroidia bacterium]|jgi:glutamate racemase|nr:glutamate racemase [Bacteroidia bacterium]